MGFWWLSAWPLGLAPLIFIALILWVSCILCRKRAPTSLAAREALDYRYASGAISEEEYERIRTQLNRP